MNAIKATGQGVRLDLELDELALLVAALNEIANGVHISDAEFETRLGFTREEARECLKRLHSLYTGLIDER